MKVLQLLMISIALVVAGAGSGLAAGWNAECFSVAGPAASAPALTLAQAPETREQRVVPVVPQRGERPQTPQGSQSLQAPQPQPVQLIPEGGCCQQVLGGCATICNKAEGCTGSGDCDVNPR